MESFLQFSHPLPFPLFLWFWVVFVSFAFFLSFFLPFFFLNNIALFHHLYSIRTLWVMLGGFLAACVTFLCDQSISVLMINRMQRRGDWHSLSITSRHYFTRERSNVIALVFFLSNWHEIIFDSIENILSCLFFIAIFFAISLSYFDL